MRKLILLRGLPGSGKSTFIKENNLELYTVSSDQIRLLFGSTAIDTDGNIGISSLEDKIVWNKIYEILEHRFKKGLFTIFDATNIKTSDINKLKRTATKYNYSIYCVDFTDVPIDVVKERNNKREPVRRVPEFVIDRMNEKLISCEVPDDIEIVKPENFKDIFYKIEDFSKWKAIHFIGDIHGCYDALVKLIGEFKKDEMYVFCGDYIDRGIQNAKTLNYLFDLSQKRNTIFLEGNHEKHLGDWLNGDYIVSEIFKTQTLTELDNGGISLKKARRFRANLKECLYITYNGKKIFACHGGIPYIPEVIDFVSADQLIRGVGRYTDCEHIEKKFAENHPNEFLVHGHRNIDKESINPIENVFNLENSVEFGGSLRMVTFEGNNIYTSEVVNDVFTKDNEMKPSDVEKLVEDLRSNEYINEKSFGDISSFNFSRTAFEKKIWNQQTVTARGLYIDTVANKIIARSYNKFFTINENEEHQFGILKSNISFPVTAYKKENGFLGIFSSYKGQPFFATKSSLDGDYNGYFKALMYDIYGKDKINEMNFHCNKNNCTMVFEVIDTQNDPHIIEYEGDRVVLLDIIKNNITFSKLPYNQLVDIANTIGLIVKEKAIKLFTSKEFEKFYNSILNEEQDEYKEIEGFVFEDDKGFMFKLKTPYYNFWKFMRGVANGVSKNGCYKKESFLTDEYSQSFYTWLQSQYKKGIIYDSNEIIKIRNEFFETLK